MKLSEFNKIWQEAVKKNSMTIINKDDIEQTQIYFSKAEIDEEKALNWLLKQIAKNQIEKINNSNRIKEAKKIRVKKYWSEYL